MYKSGFDPYGERRKKFELFPEKKDNPLVIAFQLLLIFLVVRVCMLAGGITFGRIPYVDDMLVTIVRYFIR